MWVDRFELYSKYSAHLSPEAKDFVDEILAKSKTMKDLGGKADMGKYKSVRVVPMFEDRLFGDSSDRG